MDTVTITGLREEVLVQTSDFLAGLQLGDDLQAAVLVTAGGGAPGGGVDVSDLVGVSAVRHELLNASSALLDHPFEVFPLVYLVQDGGLALIGADYPDAHHVHLVFPQPFTGTVVLNP